MMNGSIARLLVAGLLLVPLASVNQASQVASQPTRVEDAAAHVYKTVDGIELRLHVFDSGASALRRPAIVFFFGGGWAQGTVMQFVPQATRLAALGMVAVVADYRVSNRHGTTAFDAMADARSAVRWVRDHAAALGVDPNRIAAAGGSAGGHIALGAAMFQAFDDPREDRSVPAEPNALVLFNPVVDTVDFAAPQLRTRFGDRGRDGSPLHHVRTGLPPALILHGMADSTVPYADVGKFCAASRAAGNRCDVVGYEGAGHGFFNPPNEAGRWYRETLRDAERFLTTLGYLAAPAPHP
jgi:acetyl esterase/lipase